MPLTFVRQTPRLRVAPSRALSDFAALRRSRATRPAQAKGLPHKTLFEYEKSE
jgi:hypothetical protein